MTRAEHRVSRSASSKTDITVGSSAARVLAGQDGIREWQEDVYRTLHKHPELANQEQHTAALAVDALRKA